MLLYLSQTIIISSCLIFIYKLLLQNKKDFSFNRFFLLFGTIASLLLPLSSGLFESNIVINAGINLAEIKILSTAAKHQTNFNINAESIYFFIAILLLVRLTISYTLLIFRIKKEGFTNLQSVQFSNYYQEPFSLFKWIVVPNNLNNNNLDTIIKHEQAHINLKHSYDILGIELIKAVLWINPVYYLIKKELVLCHEFQADAIASQNCPKKNYAQQLLQFKDYNAILGSQAFNQKSIKKRINMLFKKPNNKFRFKSLALVAFIAISTLMIACTKDIEHIYTAQDEDFDQVEMAMFDGGTIAMMEFVQQKIKYPVDDKANGTEGVAIIEMTIGSTGEIKDAQIAKGAEARCTEAMQQEALRVIKLMPKWIPATKEGKPVAMKMYLPIRFKLNAKS